MRVCLTVVAVLMAVGCTAAVEPAKVPVAAPTASASPAPPPTSGAEELLSRVRLLQQDAQWAQSLPLLLLADAMRLAPEEPEIWYRVGYAHAMMQQTGGTQQSALARPALERCLELSPEHALCHHFLGTVLERLEEPQLALEHYFAALRSEPAIAIGYAAPAGLCIAYKLYDAAAALVDLGLSYVPQTPDMAQRRYELYVLRFELAQVKEDQPGMLEALQRAYAAAGDSHPEMAFSLGSQYLTTAVPQVAAGRRLLSRFQAERCQGARAAAWREQCEVTAFLLQKTDGTFDASAEGEAAEPALLPEQLSAKLTLPPVPQIPPLPRRDGEHYTVWGASLALRLASHHGRTFDQPISVTGWIGHTNIAEAPRCALHRPGVADPEGCSAPVPAFWLCDSLDDARTDCLQVMGWASNYAQIWGASLQYRKPDAEPYVDSYWGTEIPQPLPQRGAQVVVNGRYGITFTMSSTGLAADPIMGNLTYKKLQWLVPPPAVLKLPGM
jgi:tetratricopeptide (TPR) repeat protein